MVKTRELNKLFTGVREDLIKYLNDYMLPSLRNTDFSKEDLMILKYDDPERRMDLLNTPLLRINKKDQVIVEVDYEDEGVFEEILNFNSCHIISLIDLIFELEPYLEKTNNIIIK